MRYSLNSLASLALLATSLFGLSPSCGTPSGDAPGVLNRRSAERNTVERIVNRRSAQRNGDTVELIGADGKSETVRIQGIDTPEKHTTPKLIRNRRSTQWNAQHAGLDRSVVKALGEAASERAAQLLPIGSSVRVASHTRGKYGRLVGNRRSAKRNVEAGQDSGASFDFGARMIADGNRRSAKRNAHSYDGGGRFPHEREDYYGQLERQARSTSAGLWGNHAMTASGHHTTGLASLDS